MVGNAPASVKHKHSSAEGEEEEEEEKELFADGPQSTCECRYRDQDISGNKQFMGDDERSERESGTGERTVPPSLIVRSIANMVASRSICEKFAGLIEL